MKEVRVSFILNPNDYVQMNLWHTRKSRWLSPFVILGLSIIMLLVLGDADQREGYLYIFPMVVVPLLIVSFFFNNWSLRQRAKRIYRTDKLLQQEQNYVFTEEHIAYSNPSGSGTMDWNDLYKVAETKQHFLLYVGKIRSLVIPKAALTSNQDIQTLRDMVSSRLDSSKRKLRQD